MARPSANSKLTTLCRFIDAFRGRSWMPVEPKHLDYANAQILLIGESFDDSHALDPTSKDEKSEQKETPQEELEKLEGEDELRVQHLKGTRPLRTGVFVFTSRTVSLMIKQAMIPSSKTLASVTRNIQVYRPLGRVFATCHHAT